MLDKINYTRINAEVPHRIVVISYRYQQNIQRKSTQETCEKELLIYFLQYDHQCFFTSIVLEVRLPSR